MVEFFFEIEKIVLRWTEYVEELFSDQRCANLIQEHLQGPEILRNEVEKCLKGMKYGKTAGIDNISCEMLKALGDFGIDTLTELCNKMYHTAYIPEDLKTSVFILLPKKPRATDCRIQNYQPNVPCSQTAPYCYTQENSTKD
ncbi:endonuclease-reverse transcriptase [Elysia marginata]|uniref:Endonuclease-reverse transcriptase n=1 Tax=Elysia marginata TaxID=1093978 RepID=A0AAV4JG74_9GAST|nr:endonuclease-reverse transcriptase [Elysia marginata]